MQALLDTLRSGEDDWVLAQAIDPQRLPSHIAIIMDGNGRWARARKLPRVAGHQAGIESVRGVVETCSQLGVKALTLYAFSLENWKRPRLEVEALWRLLTFYLRGEKDSLRRNNVRLTAIGRLELLPKHVREVLRETMAALAGNTGLQLNLAINYSGRAEIADAVNELIAEARAEGRLDRLSICEEDVSRRLYTGGLPDPDLLIRTSGEMRVSNFLLWQIAYAELYITDTLWPDFRRSDLLRAVLGYQGRDRRFGGIGPADEPLLRQMGVSAR